MTSFKSALMPALTGLLMGGWPILYAVSTPAHAQGIDDYRIEWFVPGNDNGAPRAYWTYNRGQSLDGRFGDITNRYIREVIPPQVCSAAAVIVVGVASSDNLLNKQAQHSQERAQSLAEKLSQKCLSLTPQIWKASLGGYGNHMDVFDRRGQRQPMIVVITSVLDPRGSRLTHHTLGRLLCHEEAHPDLDRGGLKEAGEPYGVDIKFYEAFRPTQNQRRNGAQHPSEMNGDGVCFPREFWGVDESANMSGWLVRHNE